MSLTLDDQVPTRLTRLISLIRALFPRIHRALTYLLEGAPAVCGQL